MGKGRGRGRGGTRGRGGNVEPPEEASPPPPSQPVPTPQRKRGRPSASSSTATDSSSWNKGKGPVVSQSIMKRLEKSLPVYESDDDLVKCSECGCGEAEALTYREFKLHNIKYHLNTAATGEEKKDLVMDHKYFARKLNEYKKLTKATVFDCPREDCTSSFKSTLGLAYHMNTCGRTAEELNAVLIECEFCHGKFSLPNLQWHRKSHENKPDEPLEQLKQLGGNTKKRVSAINARKSFKRLPDQEKSGSQNDEDNGDSYGEEDDTGSNSSPRLSINKRSQARIERDNNDYCNLAQNFLETINSDGKAWDEPVRNIEDSFLNMIDNPLQGELVKEEFESYLPQHKESVEFKYITDDGSSSYHRLKWFEGETALSESSLFQTRCPVASLFHSGGPVLSMSWHPSGKLLAVSTGKHWKEDVDVLKNQERKSCIQIYSYSSTDLSLQLQLVIGVGWGYVTHIQWSSFYPDIMDSIIPSENSMLNDVEIYCRIGYLAMACEDSTIRIMSVRIEDLKQTPNYEYKPGHKIKLYTKTPELCLKVHDSVTDDEIGNVTKFDWHEGHRFLAAGYANGTIAVYDLETKSSFLTETVMEGADKVTVINPFWVFPGHRLPVRGICFDPKNPRYLVTAGQDRILKVWDMETRMLRESKRTGIPLDMCWIRGWIHQAVSVESHVAYQSAMHNYVRVFPLGSSAGRPTSAELCNFTSLDFYHGLTAQGTDDGKVNVTYYDWFWRECDFDRNRKKKNLTVLSTTHVDPDSYTKLSSSDFNVNVKRLKKSVYHSKGFQRLGLQEEEGVYSVTLEAKFGGSGIFDVLPTSDNVEDLEESEQLSTTGSINKPESEEASVNNGESAAVEDAVNAIIQPKQRDRLIPVYEVNIREEEPKLILSFVRQRPNSAIPTTGFEHSQLEEYVRFQPFIRVNKISWSPNGKIIAVGYRNGLISLLPGEFESIFPPGSGFLANLH